MELTEIITDWQTGSGRSGLSVMHFDTSLVDVPETRDELATFWGSVGAFLDSNTRWTVRTSGRLFEDSTGSLTGEWADSDLHTAFGAVAGASVPDLAQVLVRWGTGTVLNGRFLKGRTFVPGYASTLQAEGHVGSVQQAAIQTAASILLGSTGLVVWHRPPPGSPGGGSSATVNTASVWTEFASQRRRRG